MPSTLALSIAKNPDSSVIVSPVPYLPTTQLDPEPSTKRPQRSRRPSTRKIESDEYQASSRGSSRPPTPSKPDQPPKSKKRQNGKRGDRPGRIAQPNSRTTGDNSSPEPLAVPGPELGNSFLESQGPNGKSVKASNRAEAIQRATEFLGVDASLLPTRTLEKVLAAMGDQEEDPETAPMDVEGYSAPAIMQQTKQVVFGNELPPQITAAPSNIDPTPRSSGDRTLASSQALVGVPIDEDTATESETESSIVELGPDDSVSQRLPPVVTPIHAPPSHPAHRQGNAKPPDLICVNTHHPSSVESESGSSSELDSDTSDTDSESESEEARATKYPRLADPSNTHPSYSCVSQILSHSSLQSASQRPRARSATPGNVIPQSQPTNKAALTRATTAAPASATPVNAAMPVQPLALPQLPTASDINAVLAWAAELAKQAASPSSQATQDGRPDGAFELIAKVLGDLHSHLVSTSSVAVHSHSTQAERASLRPGHLDFVEDNAEALDAEDAAITGKHIHSRRKVTLDDFPGLPRRVAKLAIPELLAIAFTRGPYETSGTLGEWAEEAYRLVWRREAPDVPYQPPPIGLIRIMVHRVSWFRGDLKTRLRLRVEAEYGFKNPPLTRKDLRRNRKLVKKLAANVFYCKDLQADTDAYEHPAVEKCIATGYFSGPDSIGMLFHEKFRPIPLPAVATILTTMQHCIKEWETGRFTKLDLNAGKQLKVYDAQLKGLIAYATPAPRRLRDFRREWFWFGVAHAGTPFKEEPPVQPITCADRVRPDTPVPEAEAGARDDSRVSAKRKRHTKNKSETSATRRPSA